MTPMTMTPMTRATHAPHVFGPPEVPADADPDRWESARELTGAVARVVLDLVLIGVVAVVMWWCLGAAL